jgi:hypothetical protein
VRRSTGTVPVSSPNADYFGADTLYASACFDARCRVAITAAGTSIDGLTRVAPRCSRRARTPEAIICAPFVGVSARL